MKSSMILIKDCKRVLNKSFKKEKDNFSFKAWAKILTTLNDSISYLDNLTE